jgi:hypothetical protein
MIKILKKNVQNWHDTFRKISDFRYLKSETSAFIENKQLVFREKMLFVHCEIRACKNFFFRTRSYIITEKSKSS